MSESKSGSRVAAVVLAAGRSQRMGSPKMVLPWGEVTIIEKVVSSLHHGGVSEVVVVTGGARGEVERVIEGRGTRAVFNPYYQKDSMIYSLQTGLAALPADVDAVMVVLGDQPQLEAALVSELLETFCDRQDKILVPSYQNRRGHPWVIPRSFWQEIAEMEPPLTLRDFLNRHAAEISYLVVGDDSILKDVDTFEEYEQHKPE